MKYFADPTKVCSKCGKSFLTTDFYKDKSKRDGFRPDCKACTLLAADPERRAENSKKWRINNPDKMAKSQKEYYERNPKHKKLFNAKYYLSHKEQHSIRHKKWCENNKKRLRELQSSWCKNNKHKVYAKNAARRGRSKNATPLWADKTAIKKVYENCPSGFHVDHIIPLKGKNVSGLHVEYNLQYLTAHENHVKGNSI
jgi:hypothetical protein